MTYTSFALVAQQLVPIQQVLVLSDVAGVRNGDGWFSTAEVVALYRELRIPAPKNPSAILGRLRDSDLVVSPVQKAKRPWALTPLGRQRAAKLIGEFRYEEIAAGLVGTPGAEYAHGKHSVIPPSFAPPRWQAGISRLLERYPFEFNVFCMTRFPKGDNQEPDPLAETIETLRAVVAQHGLTMHLASDRQAEDDLFGNVGAYMWACQYGIGLLENRGPGANGLNSNMLIELGSMLIMGRRCAILRDSSAPSPPTDLSGQIYKRVDFDELTTVAEQTHRWLSDDLGLGRCEACPPLLENGESTNGAAQLTTNN